MRCLNGFVQVTMNAGRQGDENSCCVSVVETTKVLANSWCICPITDRSRHTTTKFLNDEKAHKGFHSTLLGGRIVRTINCTQFNRLISKAVIERKKPIKVGFCILQYAKLRLLELYYNFFDNFCDFKYFKGMEKDAEFIKLALAQDTFEHCIKLGMKNSWKEKKTEECSSPFVNLYRYFFPPTCCQDHIKHHKLNLGLIRK